MRVPGSTLNANCVNGASVEGDAYAPVLGHEWTETARDTSVSAQGLPFAFVTLDLEGYRTGSASSLGRIHRPGRRSTGC